MIKSLFIGVFIVFGIILTQSAQSQNINKKCLWIKPTPKSIRLDSLTIIPGSLSSQPAVAFDFNPITNAITLTDTLTALPDSILICYQTLSFNLSESYFKKPITAYDTFPSQKKDQEEELLFSKEKRETLFESEQIEKSGVITRGVSFGDRQNVFVNSALNLQLNGNLTEDITLNASITDQNIPYQPEGNTQQIQDFDRILIQLKHKNAELSVGDVVFNERENYFLKYYKNVQGGQIQSQYSLSDQGSGQSRLGIAVSKGKFASVQIPPIEGVQGPYRVRGPNQEAFIIILANSEKVFIDGQLLQRGFNYDYVIDYNQAEIIFNPHIIITQFTRIRVDYEYSDKTYGRTNMYATQVLNYNKWNFSGHFYREADNPNNPLTVSLSDEDKNKLSLIGDDFHNAIIPTADSIGFSENIILYEKKDTLTADGQVYQDIFVFSINPEKAFYNVIFTDVGSNNGDYILSTNTINGNVYVWVAPMNGISQGSYAPVQKINTPALKQMLALNVSHQLSHRGKISIDGAFSSHDKNRFSSIDDEDNKGWAFKVAYQQDTISISKDLFLSASINYELDHAQFRPIDRFRSIEYNRDWSLRSDTSVVRDQIVQGELSLQNLRQDHIQYIYSHRFRGNEVNGWQQQIKLNKKWGKIHLSTQAFWLNAAQEKPQWEDQKLQTDWKRLNSRLEYSLGFASLGYQYELDKNTVRTLQRDSIVESAMYFDAHQFFIKSNDTLKIRWNFYYNWRKNSRPFEGDLADGIVSETFQLNVDTRIKKTQQIKLTSTYRKLKDHFIVNAPLEEHIMGRIDWRSELIKKALQSNLSMAIANGRELKRTFVYLPVSTGEGTHTWRDDNNDGIQDLNEFYIAINPDEKNYVKIFTPTDEYIQAYTHQFNYTLDIAPPLHWRNEKNIKKWLSKFSNNLNWNILSKITDDKIINRLFPIQENLPEAAVLSWRENLRNTFFFNRSDPDFGWNVQWIKRRNKSLLSNGFEERKEQLSAINFRWAFLRYLNLQGNYEHSQMSNLSDFLTQRNYEITGNKIGTKVDYQPQNSFRISAGYTYQFKTQNVEEEDEDNKNLIWNEIGLEMRWNPTYSGNLIANFSYINIQYNGLVNTPVAYDMLNALLPGENLTWSLNWQQSIAKGLRLNFRYDGRKSEGQRTIHLGRVQVSALF